jgi:hypothetical protein
MTGIIVFLLSLSFNTVSNEHSSFTLSNPAFSGSFGEYELYVEQRDVGEITFFNFSTRLYNWGIGFSNSFDDDSYSPEKRSFASVAYHIPMPLSIGANIGLYRRFDQTDAYIDFGTWFHFGLDFGICYRNVLSQENIARILRAGASYTWKQVTATVEIEDSVLQDRIIPHILLSFDQPIRDFNVKLTGGVHYIDDTNINDMVVAALEISFRDMIRGAVLYEDNAKVLIGFNIQPRVHIEEITLVDTIRETVVVKEPIIVEKTTVIRPDDDSPKVLSSKDEEYCEEHYRRGIKHFVNDQLQDAINEWTLVTKVCPDYKDVKRYLNNARTKLELLKK